MKNSIRNITYITYMVAGAILFVLGCLERVDAFWSGMGATLLLVGGLRLLRTYRLNKNEAYREKVEVELTDERNKFISNKAWAWSGYLFVILAGVSTIVSKIAGQEQLSMASAMAVCVIITLYWICYAILKKKY